MNDIFKDMQVNVGCEYISDLLSYKRKVWHEMKRLNPADYEERQVELRIISKDKPVEKATRENATLEDVFLYYFGEKAGVNNGTI